MRRFFVADASAASTGGARTFSITTFDLSLCSLALSLCSLALSLFSCSLSVLLLSLCSLALSLCSLALSFSLCSLALSLCYLALFPLSLSFPFSSPVCLSSFTVCVSFLLFAFLIFLCLFLNIFQTVSLFLCFPVIGDDIFLNAVNLI